jgi:hypothetical protein
VTGRSFFIIELILPIAVFFYLFQSSFETELIGLSQVRTPLFSIAGDDLDHATLEIVQSEIWIEPDGGVVIADSAAYVFGFVFYVTALAVELEIFGG